jgi:hypothetical protein
MASHAQTSLPTAYRSRSVRPKSSVVPLSEAERHALHTLIRAHKTPQHLSFRAQVILLLAEGLSAPDVARRLGTTHA